MFQGSLIDVHLTTYLIKLKTKTREASYFTFYSSASFSIFQSL